jgi:hypothetical protein
MTDRQLDDVKNTRPSKSKMNAQQKAAANNKSKSTTSPHVRKPTKR